MYFFSVHASGQTQITDEAGLKAITSNLAGSYIIMNDITLTGDWTPVGDDQNPFTGTIDGNGKTIYGLKFIDSSMDGVGFIGVADGATVENLSVIGVQFYGAQDVGGIIGRAHAPVTVEKCYSSGAVNGYDHIGGIIGGSYASSPQGDFSKINNCFSTIAVISSTYQAGGIVGAAVDINVLNTYFAGVAQCTAQRTGGIVGLIDAGSVSIYNCVEMAAWLKGANGNTNRILGGINGSGYGDLNNNYSWENTEVYQNDVLYTGGQSSDFGWDGEHTDAATLKSASFYTGTLQWTDPIWKIADGNYPIFSYQTYPLDGDGIYIPVFPDRALPGKTFNAQAISALNRTVAYSSSDPTVASIDDQGLVSFIKDGTTTITFSTQGDADYKGATVTVDLKVQSISYQITTEDDLRNIQYDLAGDFTLMNDITLTQDWDQLPGTFTGKLNGNGHIIYGLTFSVPDQNNVGMFGTAQGAVITKLGIEKANITGRQNVGVLVGNSLGCTISECYAADSYIAGYDHVGSLVGGMYSYNDSILGQVYTTVADCYSGAQVNSREYQAGGIAGVIAGGSLRNCYFSGIVQAVTGRAAGIVSLVDSDDPGEIINNVNLADGIYCPAGTYRICDWDTHPTTTTFSNNWSALNSYCGSNFDAATVRITDDVTSKDGGLLADDNLARTQSFYTTTLGWDFTNVWKYIDGTDGKMYPILEWQEAPLVTKVYGIPEYPSLVYPDPPLSPHKVDLNRIIPSYGQALTFTITEGADNVVNYANILYINSINPPTAGGWTKFALSLDSSLDGLFSMDVSEMDVEIVLASQVFDVKTPDDVISMSGKPFANFRLVNDIDMSGIDFSGIGSLNSPFTGTFDGNGFSIINAKVKVTSDQQTERGFFNATQGATIKNFGLSNFSFDGTSYGVADNSNLGGLIGSCNSTNIDQCYVTGTIIGGDHVGGLIGGNCNNDSISNTYVDVTINSYSQTGGFLGVTDGNITVTNSYFKGNISATGRGWVGGIIGLIDKQGIIKVSSCVSIGDVSSIEVAGPFIGENGAYNGNLATVSLFYNNIYNTDANINGQTGWNVSSPVPGSVENPTGKSSAQLKQQATYTGIGWDFSNIWTITEGQTYPQLKNVPFKQTPAESIQSVKADENGYVVYAENNNIHISGIRQSATVAVYNLNGQMLSLSVVNNNAVVPVSNKGIYIVRITENDKTNAVKVINK